MGFLNILGLVTVLSPRLSFKSEMRKKQTKAKDYSTKTQNSCFNRFSLTQELRKEKRSH